MNAENNTPPNHDSAHLPEPPAWLKLLIALGVATLAYRLLGEREATVCLVAGVGHTLTPLLETLWHSGLHWLQKRMKKRLKEPQIRALILCGVVLAVGVGVPAGHKLTPPMPRHSTATLK